MELLEEDILHCSGSYEVPLWSAVTALRTSMATFGKQPGHHQPLLNGPFAPRHLVPGGGAASFFQRALLLQRARQLAIMVGASLGGLLFDLGGYQSTFVVSAALLGGAALLAIRASRDACVGDADVRMASLKSAA